MMSDFSVLTETEKDLQKSGVLKLGKTKVLLLSIWYPLSMSRYFERALKQRDDVDLRTVGPYTGNSIPWQGGMNLPAKYAKPPTYITPQSARLSYDMFKGMWEGEDWFPDIILTVDAGICWDARPNAGAKVIHVATDPHCLDYDFQRSTSDIFFNMQHSYMKEGDKYLPYAFDPTWMYPDDVDKEADAVLIGMPYQQRVSWVNRLRASGVGVYFENGPVFDEYRIINCRAKIGLNWSSLDDLNCRVFELMAMRLCPVINRVTDLPMFFTEGTHYLGFSNEDEAVEKVLWAKNNPVEAYQIACNAYDEVWKRENNIYPQHSYDQRVETILNEYFSNLA